jgi:3-hydroxyisobutyrate dehydrogenase-like beta-hydroxyacid dehydrogenase
VTRIAWLGLGIMGSRQAVHLVRAGHELTVWNRTAEKADAWIAEHRARAAATPAAAVDGAKVVFSMLVDGPQVRAVMADAAPGLGDEAVWVDMSTIGPEEARRAAELVGGRFLDAPVTGSSPKAADGTLTIMVGGERMDFARVEPLLETMGSLVRHVGPVGHGQLIKLINNAVAAANTVTVGEALLAGEAAGVDLDALVEIVGAGSGGSAMLDLKAGPMREHDYTTLFKLEHMLKDVRLCLQAAPFDAARTAEQILTAGQEHGLGSQDFAALLEILEERAGTRLSGRAFDR